MNLLQRLIFGENRRFVRVEHITQWYSHALSRNVRFDIYLPRAYNRSNTEKFPLLLINDGQDLLRMNFKEILRQLYSNRALPPLIIVGIHAGADRIREYGTASEADYKGRGDRAGHYKAFILKELMPFLYANYPLTEVADERAFAGFSLGGLSALDIAWNEPSVFGGAGIFSGALWWRRHDVRPDDPDADRIMHDIILRKEDQRPNHQYFWFQVGTLDEDEDRNNNGIIDAIDDTRDCISAIKRRGYHDSHLRYIEIENGTHDPETWAKAMPDFLRWMFIDEWDED